MISPLLANIYLHYVLDLWIEAWRKRTKEDVIIVRYADDFVLGFQSKGQAEACLKALRDRFGKFGLTLHPEKTRLIEFGRFARSNRQRRGEGRPETFDFLGFTHRCDVSRLRGRFMVRRETIAKRMRATLASIKEQLRCRLHHSLGDVGRWLGRVVAGWFRYHAVPGNITRLNQFRKAVGHLWLRAIRRRCQKWGWNWPRLTRLLDRYVPRARILHAYPIDRFHARLHVGAV